MKIISHESLTKKQRTSSEWKKAICCMLLPDNVFLCHVNRYHYNVADARLAQHIERGMADGLLISCVASCSNLWALIMDAGTGFTNQVYELSPFFLHKVNCLFCILYFLWVPCLIIIELIEWTKIISLFFQICRSGLWNSGKRTIILVPLLVLTMEALL